MKPLDEETKRRLEGFRREYRELCQKYGLHVTSCGCCEDWIMDPETMREYPLEEESP